MRDKARAALILTATLCLACSCTKEHSKPDIPAEGVTFSIPETLSEDRVSDMVEERDCKDNKFYGSLAFLKMSITSATAVDIRRISLHDLGGNMLWGHFYIPAKDGSLAYDEISASEGSNTIVLEFSDGIQFGASEKTIFFPVPHGSLDRGFSLTLYEFDPTKTDNAGRAYSFIQNADSRAGARNAEIIDIGAISLSENSEPYDVKARGYYKSLFIDAGVDLLDYYKPSDLPFIEECGLGADYEYFVADTNTVSQIAVQRQCFARTTADGLGWSDQNGQLLYPDGEPRFRLLFVNGGFSKNHGLSLSKQALDNVNSFYRNGGSYVGVCAGSFLATTFYGNTRRYGNADTEEDCSFGIWPGSLSPSRIPVTINDVTVDGTKYKGWGTVVTGMKVISDELADYSFAVGDTLQNTAHLGGCYLSKTSSNLSFNPDILATYQFVDPDKYQSRPAEYHYTQENLDKTEFPNPFYAYNSRGEKTNSRNLVDSVSTFAYKASSISGRAVLCGSHPERKKAGNRQLQYMKMMVDYAIDGNGAPAVKKELEMNETLVMNKSWDDGDPKHTKIGDRQYHHFIFNNVTELENVMIELNCSAPGVNLFLALRMDDYAWISDADYVLCNDGGDKYFNVKKLPAGKWYISVYCASTIDSSPNAEGGYPHYFKYSGHTELLDGIPYSISIKTKAPFEI